MSASACPRPRGNGFHRWALHCSAAGSRNRNAWRAGAGTGPPAKDRSATPWPVRACGPAVFTNGDRRVYVLSAQAWHGRTGRTPHDGMAWHGMARQQHAPVRELLPVLLGWVDRQAPGSSATLWFPAFLARFCSRHGRKGPREKRWVQLPVPMASWDRRRLALWLVSCSTNSGPSASASARLLAERPDFADSSEDRTN